MIRTDLTEEMLGDEGVVRAYKSLARVERAFRSLKTVVLNLRPIFHRRERRVRAHLFLCMLAYYFEWHTSRRLGPLLFAEEGGPSRAGSSLARRSAHGRRDAKIARARRLEGRLPPQSFPDLLASLAPLTAVELMYRVRPDSTTQLIVGESWG